MPFIPELLNFLNDTFVETGTFQGDTLNIIANNKFVPSKIISLELSDVFFTNCTKRFELNPNIIIYKANSKYDLYDKIKDINNKITFWLDSHWSGTPDVGCDSETICPILEELEQIKQHSNKTHTIMIDDIRLMSNCNDKYIGFPVKLNEILEKLYQINPNYKIQYFDDYSAKNDILVAYIEKKFENEIEKYCIHKYLINCKTNPQPPGFADFLRGTIALYKFSQKYNYKLYIDGEHPLFNYLKKNKNIFNKYKNTKIEIEIVTEIEEYLPPLSYDNIYVQLENKFKSGKSFSALTNSFYNLHNENLNNYGEITPECSKFLKDILSPTIEVENKLSYIFNDIYKINMDSRFIVIHLRFGDNFIQDNVYNDYLYNLYYNKINNIINFDNEKYVLITDSKEIGTKIKLNIPELLYWDNNKIHMGTLNKEYSYILDTMVDFFIISKANEIFSNGSGFSTINSVIYNIKYNLF